MKIKIKQINPDSQTPTYGRLGDAGFDLYSVEDYELKPGQRKVFNIGIAFEIPQDYVMLIWDRSGLPIKHGITTLAGVIDSNFRGEVGVCLLNTSTENYQIKKGDRIAQALIQKVENVEFDEVSELSTTKRGENWQASSGY